MRRDSSLDPLAAIRRAETVCLQSGRSNGTACWVCGRVISHRSKATVHYIVPIAEGGDPLDPGNLTPIHRECAPVVNSRRW
ncbi:MAG: HNH endonuclease signature motif containing protein [Pseudonocardiaceae bacterium]